MSAENGGKPLGVWGSVPNPAGELNDSLWERVAAPSPRTPATLSAYVPSVLALTMINPGHGFAPSMFAVSK